MIVLLQLHFLSDAMHLGHKRRHGFLTLLSTPDAVLEYSSYPSPRHSRRTHSTSADTEVL